MDYFQGLMVRAGVPPHALPKDGRSITPDEALKLLSWLLSADVKMRDFGPWRMASYLLWEVVNGERPVSRQEMYERMRRFAQLLVLRPDGYLVLATTGEALQYVDKVRLENSALRAEDFEVGPFYTVVQGRFLYPVDGSLTRHPDARVAGVFSPDKGVLGPAAEGAGLAVVDTVTGIVALVLHPRESLEGLAQLPSAVRSLIEHSPEYWEHFRSLPSGEQVRDVSRLLTNVLITCGTAGAGSAKAASAAGKILWSPSHGSRRRAPRNCSTMLNANSGSPMESPSDGMSQSPRRPRPFVDSSKRITTVPSRSFTLQSSAEKDCLLD
jgi:hypothetical protein